MIALIPVNRFRVKYEVAVGRPFSRFEQLILRAIQGGVNDVEQLQGIFEVHPRLLIEGLVTLTQAGWIAIGGTDQKGFVLTSEGRDAAGSETPPKTTAVYSRRTVLVMERVTGSLLGREDVRPRNRRELKDIWDDCLRMSPEVFDNRLSDDQVQFLLPLTSDERIRWIGPIDLISKEYNWVPASVDVEAGTVIGLPEEWKHRFQDSVLLAARRFSANISDEARSRKWRVSGFSASRAEPVDSDSGRVSRNEWAASIHRDDLCLTGGEHERLLAEALDRARTSLFIASAFATADKLTSLRPKLEAALSRGVNVDLLWGYTTETQAEGRAAVDALKKLAYDAKHDGLTGVLRFNPGGSGSHAKLLMWDTDSGFLACVGSYNWLSARFDEANDGEATNATVRLSSAGAVGALARCAAALWSAVQSERLSSTGDRWRRIAAAQESLPEPLPAVPTNAAVHILLDRNHEQLFREWMRTAQTRLLVASQTVGPTTFNRLISGDVARPAGFEFEIFYADGDPAFVGDPRLVDLVQRCRGTLRRRPKLHAKVIVSDASSCITSYNFLSADPFGKFKQNRELGVVIDGAEPADWLWSRLR